MKTLLTTVILTTCTLGLFAGCSDNGDDSMDVSFDGITDDLTPSLIGTTQRPIDLEANLAMVNDENMRMLIDDLQRVFYTDHPSRLSPYPITYRNGMPR